MAMTGKDAGRGHRPSPTASGIGGMAEGQSAQPTERSESRKARPAKRVMPEGVFRERRIARNQPVRRGEADRAGDRKAKTALWPIARQA
jgi:hypothetical protein